MMTLARPQSVHPKNPTEERSTVRFCVKDTTAFSGNGIELSGGGEGDGSDGGDPHRRRI